MAHAEKLKTALACESTTRKRKWRSQSLTLNSDKQTCNGQVIPVDAWSPDIEGRILVLQRKYFDMMLAGLEKIESRLKA